MLIQELLALHEAKVPKSIKGWLAMADSDGATNNIEGIFVFDSKAAANTYFKGLSNELEGSDSYATQMTVDEYHIVFYCDHRVDEEELAPIMFDRSKPNLMKRLKADIAAGAIYGIDSFDQVKDDVSILKTD